MKDVLNVQDVADLCGCSPDTIREAAIVGELPGIKLGRDWIFPREALIRVLNTKAIEAAAAIKKTAIDVADKLRGNEKVRAEAPESPTQAAQRLKNQQATKAINAIPFNPLGVNNIKDTADLKDMVEKYYARQAELRDLLPETKRT